MFFTRNLRFLSAASVFHTNKKLLSVIKSPPLLCGTCPLPCLGAREPFKFLCFERWRCFCSETINAAASNNTLPPVYVGAKVVVTKIISQNIVELFAKATGDWNPVHFPSNKGAGTKSGGLFKSENNSPETTKEKTPIVHGALLNGMVSGVIGTQLPGPGTLLVSQSLSYSGVLPVGSKVEVEVEVIGCKKREVNVQYKVVSCADGLVVMNGVARLMVPKGRIGKLS